MRFMTMVKSSEAAGPPPQALMDAIAKLGEEAAKAPLAEQIEVNFVELGLQTGKRAWGHGPTLRSRAAPLRSGKTCGCRSAWQCRS